MSNATVSYELTIKPREAKIGTKRILSRKGKRLEITIPVGVKTGTLVKLSGALQITDGYNGDILIQIKVKSRRRGVLAVTAMAGLLIIIICSVVIGYFVPNSGSENINEGTGESTRHIYHSGGIECGGDGKPIELVNNPDATNPTYADLIAFIMYDTTDTNSYIEEGPGAYVCADFAEDVHNNAEAAGIRAAWVAVEFEGDEEGHALNAFETTDKGLVYIDCTKWEIIAYIEEGKEYDGGIIIGKQEWLEFESPSIVKDIYIFW